jgi:beta-galactosidase
MPALVRQGKRHYLAAWPSRELAIDLAQKILSDEGVAATLLHEDVRVRRRGNVTFAFNFGSDSQQTTADANASYLLGGQTISAHNLSAWFS